MRIKINNHFTIRPYKKLALIAKTSSLIFNMFGIKIDILGVLTVFTLVYNVGYKV